MRIGIFGGTFNPIHEGHVRLARHYIRELELDKLLIIPTKYPPHKISKDLAASKDRLEMCRRAFSETRQVEVSDIEMKRPGRSYTIDTIRQLREIYPDDKLFLIVGGDMFRSFHKWYCFEEILRNCAICTAARERGEYQDLNRYAIYLRQFTENIIILEMPVLELSSTEIRDCIRRGEDCWSLLPHEVYAYIRRNHLYEADPAHEEAVEKYTEAIRSLLKPSRLEHSLNVAKRAMALADLNGEDVKKAEIAGLLHDICKNMPEEEQLHWTKKSAIIFDDPFWAQPQLWHGYAAAEYVKEELGVTDPDILSAIRCHTVGKADMTTFEKIIFLADLTSEERDYPDVQSVRDTVEESLDAGMKVAMEFIMGKLQANQQPITADSQACYDCYVLGKR